MSYSQYLRVPPDVTNQILLKFINYLSLNTSVASKKNPT